MVTYLDTRFRKILLKSRVHKASPFPIVPSGIMMLGPTMFIKSSCLILTLVQHDATYGRCGSKVLQLYYTAMVFDCTTSDPTLPAGNRSTNNPIVLFTH